MITKRIIPCLDVKDGRVVKGVNFEGLRDMAVLVVRLYSQLTMLRHGLKEERKSYLYVLRHLQRTSQE